MGETRTVRTPAERVAALEAELAAARERAQAKDAKRASVLQEQRAKLIVQISDRETKVAAIEAELDELGFEYSSVSVETLTPSVVPVEDLRV
jgi:hypothetical protein